MLRFLKTQRSPWLRLSGEALAIIFIGVIAVIAKATGATYVLFPELAALAHDVLTRPQGAWARAPGLLALTPVLTAVAGMFFCLALPYGYLSVSLTIAAAIAIILALKSPIAPAISAGLLPLVLDVKSWWYVPGILLGTALLAVLSVAWNRLIPRVGLEYPPTPEDLADSLTELAPTGYWWLIPLGSFIIAAVFLVETTGLRLILFPPLVVIGFEMFGHPTICPWAKRPFLLPVASFLTALGGLLFAQWLGVGLAAAVCSMAWGIVVLRIFDLHVPPALAVALLPLVMRSPTFAYPLSVGLGTLLMTLWFLSYRHVRNRWKFG